MYHSLRSLAAIIAGGWVVLMPLSAALAGESKDGSRTKSDPPRAKEAPEIPAVNLLDAIRDHQVSVQAEGTGDGRMTMSLTNRTKRKLRVVLPPGIVAQGATGQFGGMGGMGGGMGGMGGGMGGMGMAAWAGWAEGWAGWAAEGWAAAVSEVWAAA